MQMDEVIENFDAKAGFLKELTTFLAEAETKDFRALKKALGAFNQDTDCHGIEYSAIPNLFMALAKREGNKTPAFLEAVENMACDCYLLVRRMSHADSNHAVAELKLLDDLLGRLRGTANAKNNTLAIMRELVAEKSDPKNVEPAASIDRLSETLKAAEPAAQDPDPDNLDENSPALHPLEWMRLKYEKSKKENWGSIHFTMNIYRDGYTDLGVDLDEDDFKAIIAGWKMQQVEDEEPAPNPEAEPLVDDMVATFEKLRGVLARQKEVPAQE
jgi:hypothetical protein